MLWEVDIHPRAGVPNRNAQRAAAEMAELGLPASARVAAARGYLLEAAGLDRADVERLASELLVDRVVEDDVIAPVGDEALVEPPSELHERDVRLVQVVPKAGVMDPVAQSAQQSARGLGVPLENVRTLRKYWLSGLDNGAVERITRRALANEAIEEAFFGRLPFQRLQLGVRVRVADRSAGGTG